uniref:ribosomal protein S3 n=1 Tax=Griffithsia okiensis TaxID=291168 RepID=UPI002E769B68|nr:ribosomal protein S3 [Griffithsia okiensis]WQF69528.1 ribosomal protein S3 [Griffithsia okiensis]
MSKKSNSLILKFGVTKNFNFFSQNYGKSTLNIDLNILKLCFCLNKYFFSNNLILIFNEFHLNKNLFSLSVFCLKNNFNMKSYLILLNNINFNFLFTFKKQKNKLFLKNEWFYSSFLLKNYINFLFLKFGINNYKKILGILTKLFCSYLNYNQIFYSIYGPKLIILKGFKIQLKGRFENSKNQMTKKIELKSGILSSVNLNSDINYLNNFLFTKLGLWSLKIWLFYKIKNL